MAGVGVARYLAPSLPFAAAAAAPGEALGARAGPAPCAGGVRGAAAWSAGAVTACRGRGLSSLCTRGPLRGRGGKGRGLSGRGGLLGLRGLLGRRLGVDEGRPGLPDRWPDGTAASASRCSSRSARVFPAHPGETGEQERDRRWWRLSRWGEPSESDITVILVGMRGGRRVRSTTSYCISGAPWAVPCSAARRGGGEGRVGWRSGWSRVGRGRWSSIGTRAGGW